MIFLPKLITGQALCVCSKTLKDCQMAKIDFKRVEGQELSDREISFLEAASAAMGGYLSLEMARIQEAAGAGAFYSCFADNALTGCLFLNIRVTHLGKSLSLLLLGGDGFKEWSSSLVEFLYGIAEENKADVFTVVGRKGWGKMFKELEHMGCIYQKKLVVGPFE